MGLVMSCISEKTNNSLSLLQGQSECTSSSNISRCKPTLEKAGDSVEVSIKKAQKFDLNVSVSKTRRVKSSTSSKSGTSPRVSYDLAVSRTSREKLLSEDSSWDALGRGFFWSSPIPSVTDSFTIFPMTKVHSNLYIGNEENSNDKDMINSKGITHILSLVGHQSSVRTVERKLYPMSDKGKSDIKVVLDEVWEFMESGQKDNNNLLVHCKLGQNRSAVVVIAFLMKKFKKTLHRAHRDLKKVRPIVQVNVDYAKQLLVLEREYFGNNSLPANWMEREYNEALNDVVYKHEDLTTLHQRLMYADIEEKKNS